ncbi:MAG: hypothetical protein NT145_02305 [Elusimicrobia bacterium]|nr:hypothetical protein [Elusimicrobiota bacterium]
MEDNKKLLSDDKTEKSKLALFIKFALDAVLFTFSAIFCTLFYLNLALFLITNFNISSFQLKISLIPKTDLSMFVITSLILLLLLLLTKRLSLVSTVLFIVKYPYVIIKYILILFIRSLAIFVKLFPKLSIITFAIIILFNIYISLDVANQGFLKKNIPYLLIFLILLNMLILFAFVFSDIFSIFIPSINETLEKIKKKFSKDLEKYSKTSDKKTEERIVESYFFLTRIEKTIKKHVSVATLTVIFTLVFTMSFFTNILLFGFLYKELDTLFSGILSKSSGISSLTDKIIFSFYVLQGNVNVPTNALPAPFKAAMISEMVVGVLYLTLLFTLFSHVSTEKLRETRDNIVRSITETKDIIRNMVDEKIDLDSKEELTNLSITYVLSALMIGNFIKRAKSLKKNKQ